MKDSIDSSFPPGYSLKLLEAILNAGTASICVKDREGRFVYLNEADASLYNAKPQEMLGKTVEPFLGKAQFEEWYRQDMAVLNSGVKQHLEPYTRTGKDGKVRWFDTLKIPFTDEHDGQALLLVIHRDITTLMEVDRARQALEVANLDLRTTTEELTQAYRELESFSYSVSHDLRAPLRTIDGFSQMVLRKYGEQLPPEGRRYLQTVCESAHRMGVLIDDLLTFSRLSRSPLNGQFVNTDKLVREVLEGLNSEQENRQVEIRIENLPSCQGDPALLKQVWVNLLSNALKYTRQRTTAVIEVGCKQEQDEPIYFVRDNGAGFDMRHADKLFGVFQRLHRNEEFEGTGIGLAIVQHIIHRHGGRIWAEATLDHGASFYFTLNGRIKE